MRAISCDTRMSKRFHEECQRVGSYNIKCTPLMQVHDTSHRFDWVVLFKDCKGVDLCIPFAPAESETYVEGKWLRPTVHATFTSSSSRLGLAFLMLTDLMS